MKKRFYIVRRNRNPFSFEKRGGFAARVASFGVSYLFLAIHTSTPLSQ